MTSKIFTRWRKPSTCIGSSAVASTRSLIADALDLRHRLPSWWQAVQDLRLEAWIARKAAVMTRQLDYEASVRSETRIRSGPAACARCDASLT